MIPAKTRRRVLRKAQHRCEFCNKPEREQRRERKDNGGLHAHHIWPRREDGGNSAHNLIALCDDCHAQVEARTRFKIRSHRDEPNRITKQRVQLLIAENLREGHRLRVRLGTIARHRLWAYGVEPPV